MNTIEQNNTIESTKKEFNRTKDRMVKLLNLTPDDKAGWAPSPTARTPLALVAHAAFSTRGITNMAKGEDFPFNDFQAIDVACLEEEKGIQSKQQAIDLLDETAGEFFDYLDSLTPAQLDEIVEVPFGKLPRSVFITFPNMHMQGHMAQLEYVQTIYGDRNWHYGN